MSDMPKKKTKKASEWSDIRGGQAFIIPIDLLNHRNFIRLSPHAHKLIHDLARQFTGSNNGYLNPGIKVMSKFGWKSPTTLHKTVQELLHFGIISLTRQGGKNMAGLYAFTFRRIHEIKSKPLDVRPSLTPSDDWLRVREDFGGVAKRADKKSLVHVVDKVCTPDVQVSEQFVRQLYKPTDTCTPVV